MTTYNEGDLVEAAKGETVIRGRVELSPHYGEPMLPLPGVGAHVTQHLSYYPRDGFTLTVIEKAAQKLPTEPGYYAEAGKSVAFTHLWILAENGRWISGASNRYDDRPAEFAPFVKLEPVTETAKKVIDALWPVDWSPETPTREDAARIAKQFGVEA